MIATIMKKNTTIPFLFLLVLLLLLLSITADLFNNGGRISSGVIGVAASSSEEEVSSAAASLIAGGIINKPGTVIDLTPELYKKLLSINNKGYNFSRFFIKINTKKCLLRPDLDNVCDIISDVVWKPFVGATNTTDTNVVDVQVYVHDKNNKINTIENNNIPDFCHIVPTVYTNRLTISIVRAAIQLLRYAMHHQNGNSSTSTTRDGNNSNDAESDRDTHYILVSGDSIPLLSAQDIVNELTRTKTKNDESESKLSKSRFEKYPDDEQHTPYIFRYGTNVDNPNVGYGTGDIQMGGGFAQPATNYGYAKVFRSTLWFSMTHKDAVWFANPRNDETSNFEMMITSDEYYFATLANEYYNNNQNQNQNQGPGQFEHNLPFMYESVDINPDKSSPGISDYVDDTIYKKFGHLFARTITSETQVVLSWLNNINYNNNNGGGGGGGNSNSNSNSNSDATISSMTKVDLSHTGEIIFDEQLVNFQQQKNKTSQS